MVSTEARLAKRHNKWIRAIQEASEVDLEDAAEGEDAVDREAHSEDEEDHKSVHETLLFLEVKSMIILSLQTETFSLRH